MIITLLLLLRIKQAHPWFQASSQGLGKNDCYDDDYDDDDIDDNLNNDMNIDEDDDDDMILYIYIYMILLMHDDILLLL